MDKLPEKKLSRRSFLTETGKIIALGALANFVLVGRAQAGEFAAREDCRTSNLCESKYSCSTPGSHRCRVAAGFICDKTDFNCTGASHYAE